MNRLVNESDIALYGAKLGDVIIDTPNKTNSDGTKAISYYFMGKEWPMLKGEVTFWFDGDKLGFLNFIKFQNTVDELPWPCDTVIFRAIPGTKVKGNTMIVKGMNHFKLKKSKPVIPNWDVNGKFLTGSFDFQMIQNTPSGHGYDISVQPDGSIEMESFEAQHGFAGLRLQQKNRPIDVYNLTLSDFYIHDTENGEGQYIGSTQVPPIPRFKNARISNGIITRTAAEGFQGQNLMNADVHNITFFALDTDWLNAFKPNQDKAIQYKAGPGINRFRNCIIDGYAANGFMGFSNPDFIPEPENKVLIDEVLFYNGRGAGMYFNMDCKNGVDWIFNNAYFGGFNGSYYETGAQKRPMIANAGTDKVIFTKLIHDGSRNDIFDNISKYQGEILHQTFDGPQYVNSGFHENVSNIMQWKEYYGAYLSGPDKRVVYKAGTIAIDAKNGYAFYKALQVNSSDTGRPSESAHWEKLTWDVNGVRSDRPGFTTPFSNLPPDDLRLINGPWMHMGIQTKERILEEYYTGGQRVTITNANTYISK